MPTPKQKPNHKKNKNMKVTDAFEGNYIDALCVTGKDAKLTIASVAAPNTEKSADGKTIDRPVVRFKETDKGLILNKTNAKCIGLAHGNEMDNWEGKQITLFATTTDAFGKRNVPCVRVRPANLFKK